MKEAGVEVFLPLHLSPRKWSDRVKYVEMPLFSSYIFVRTTHEVLYSLLKTYGVSRIVYYQGKPAIVRDSEIERIQLFVEKARGKACEFVYDDEVKVAAGPLVNVQARVMKQVGDQLYLKVEQIGVTIRISSDQVIK